MERWLVIIARDRPELWVTWASFYGGAEKVEVLLDRRQEQPGTKRGLLRFVWVKIRAESPNVLVPQGVS